MIIEFIASVAFNILSIAHFRRVLFITTKINWVIKKCKILMTFQNTLSILWFNNEIKWVVKINMSCFWCDSYLTQVEEDIINSFPMRISNIAVHFYGCLITKQHIPILCVIENLRHSQIGNPRNSFLCSTCVDYEKIFNNLCLPKLSAI